MKLASTGRQEGQPPGQPRRSRRLRLRLRQGRRQPANFSETVRANYDIVGFDPRGVKRSAPVTCLTDKERDEARAKIYAPDTDAGMAAASRRQQGHRRQVRREDRRRSLATSTPSAPPRTWTSCAPWSMTPSSTTWAFPTAPSSAPPTRRCSRTTWAGMVLDGAIDPSLSNEELTRGQAKAFEKALRAYVENACRRAAAR